MDEVWNGFRWLRAWSQTALHCLSVLIHDPDLYGFSLWLLPAPRLAAVNLRACALRLQTRNPLMNSPHNALISFVKFPHATQAHSGINAVPLQASLSQSCFSRLHPLTAAEIAVRQTANSPRSDPLNQIKCHTNRK